jgi:hypothetical protein
MGGRRSFASLSAALMLALGATFPGHGADFFERDDIIHDPVPGRFSVCHGHGCRNLDTVALSGAEWKEISFIFQQVINDPAVERDRIRQAIGMLETRVGKITGTAGDKGGNWAGFGLDGQMDCIDESINTTTYLRMLAGQGLITQHTVEGRETRGWFIFGWPHTTAVIRERASGQLWVVDSWFLDNGEPPFILPLTVWKQGWQPPRPPASQRSPSVTGSGM